MFKRQYVCSAQICHSNGTGDKEYWNGIVTIKSWLKPSGEDLVCTVRRIAINKMEDGIERSVCENDVQILTLNRI